MSARPAGPRGYASRVVALLLLLLIIAVLVRPEPRVRPEPIRRYGGERLPWDAGTLALWDTVMRCVGLDPTPDRRLTVWVLPADAPRILRGPETLDVFDGQYVTHLHALWFRDTDDTAERRLRLAHELVHGRLHTYADLHEAVFFTRGPACGLGDTTRYGGERR